MKKLLSFILAATIFCSATVTAGAQTTQKATGPSIRSFTSTSIQPRLSYIAIGSYGMEMEGNTAYPYATIDLYNGNGCKIDATLQSFNTNNNSWSKVTSWSTGKVNDTTCLLGEEYPSCMVGKAYRVQFKFYAYVGSTVKETVTEYSNEEICY